VSCYEPDPSCWGVSLQWCRLLSKIFCRQSNLNFCLSLITTQATYCSRPLTFKQSYRLREVWIRVAKNSFQHLDFDGSFITTLYHLVLQSWYLPTRRCHFRDTIGCHSNGILADVPLKLKEIYISTYHNWALKPQLAGGRPVGYLQQDRVVKLGPTEKQVEPISQSGTWTRDLRISTPSPYQPLDHFLSPLFQQIVIRNWTNDKSPMMFITALVTQFTAASFLIREIVPRGRERGRWKLKHEEVGDVGRHV